MESKAKSKAAPKTEALAPIPTNGPFNWLIKKVDEDTGEEYDAPKYKYIPGNPRDYRTDMRGGGGIKINGLKEVPVPFTLQVIACKGFTSNLFDMGEKDWVELWFIDAQNCVSAMLFHGFSYEAFLELLAPLEYDELKISDVLVTITLEEKDNKALKTKYLIASFTYEPAPDKARTKELKAFAREHKLFRKATIKEGEVIHFNHGVHDPLQEVKEISE